MTAWRIRVRHGARLVTLTYGPAGGFPGKTILFEDVDVYVSLDMMLA